MLALVIARERIVHLLTNLRCSARVLSLPAVLDERAFRCGAIRSSAEGISYSGVFARALFGGRHFRIAARL